MRPTFRNSKLKKGRGAVYYISLIFFIISVSAFVAYVAFYIKDWHTNNKNVAELREIREKYRRESELQMSQTAVNSQTPTPTETPVVIVTPETTKDPEETGEPLPNGDPTPIPTASPTPSASPSPTPTPEPPKRLPFAEHNLGINPEYIGWLDILDTNPEISYPVVQERPYDKEYYLKHELNGATNDNGTLFTIEQCEVGVGTKANNYYGGVAPSTNILIFGHNMASKQMFGNLDLYRKQDHYERHKYIYFETCYETRKYEVIAAFRSQEYEDPYDDHFKYYFFFNANTQEEFDYWYSNIKAMSLIKCDATAKFGDEFLTLSTCNGADETGKKNKNGRFAVVAVRVE